MAAGCSLPEEHVEEFRRRLNSQTVLTQEDLVNKVVIDVPMPLGYISERLIRELEYLEPFGKGNSKPVFAVRDIAVLGAKMAGSGNRVVRMKLMDPSGTVMEAVYFGDALVFREYLEQKYGAAQTELVFQNRRNAVRLDVIYYPAIHEFNGLRSIQIVVQNYK